MIQSSDCINVTTFLNFPIYGVVFWLYRPISAYAAVKLLKLHHWTSIETATFALVEHVW